MSMLRKSNLHYIGKNVSLGKNVKIGFKAYIEEGAKIGRNVKISPFAIIHSGSIIEDDCIIGNHCIIGHPSKLQLQKTDFSATSPKVTDFIVKESVTRIGEGSIIRSGSTIYTHVIVGKKLRTGHNVLIREHVTIGDNCIVGTQAILDGYIKVGNKSMIQSQCYIAQSVRIGNGVFIAPGCIFLDNKKIILGQGLEGPTVEDYVRISAGTKILSGMTIGKYALIGAGSVVTKDIPSKAIAYGAPAEIKGFQSDKEIEAYVNSIMAWK
jgi:acetyltransferase-like isoleucine patch superfamily enzyme